MAPVQRKGLKALQLWCAQVTSSYSGVNVTDLSSSFRDGLAFNAIIHHFRPQLFDFDALDPSMIRENNAHAFRVAEEELNIPALLDPEDMVDCEEPDKLSVATYLQQFYHAFKNDSPSPMAPRTRSRTALARLSSSDSDNGSMGSSPDTPSSGRSRVFNRDDLIAKYGEDIFKSSKDEDSLLESPHGGNSVFNREDLVAKYGEGIFSKAPSGPEESSVKSGESVASVCKQFELKARVSAS